MKLLALDTTTDISSIALADENGLIAEYNFAHRQNLSVRLMPDIVALLKDCGMEVKDLEGIGVSLGPGSFTGLRIGVVTAKTLAQTLGISIAGIVTLDLIARQFDYLPMPTICPIIKVRKGEVYYAFFRNGGRERVSEYEAQTVERLIEDALKLDAPHIIFCGDALKDNLAALQAGLGDRAIPAADWLAYPKASILAKLALEKIAAGNADDLMTMSPFYIRRSAPEMRLESQGKDGVAE